MICQTMTTHQLIFAELKDLISSLFADEVLNDIVLLKSILVEHLSSWMSLPRYAYI